MTIDFLVLSKIIYLSMMSVSVALCARAHKFRHKNKQLYNISIFYKMLTPSFMCLGVTFVFTLNISSTLTLIGWAIVNMFFIMTDSMLLEYAIRHSIDREFLKRELDKETYERLINRYDDQ